MQRYDLIKGKSLLMLYDSAKVEARRQQIKEVASAVGGEIQHSGK